MGPFYSRIWEKSVDRRLRVVKYSGNFRLLFLESSKWSRAGGGGGGGGGLGSILQQFFAAVADALTFCTKNPEMQDLFFRPYKMCVRKILTR